MIIGVDLDDVLVDSSWLFIDFCNGFYGTKFRKEEVIHEAFYKMWDISQQELLVRFYEYLQTDRQSDLVPMQGAQETVAILAGGHVLHLITNRAVEVKQETIQWVERHFPGAFSDFHFCSKKGKAVALRSKSSVCKTIGVKFMLEDHPDNVYGCAEDGIHVCLFDQPWNRREFPLFAGVIIRVLSWEDKKILETLFS